MANYGKIARRAVEIYREQRLPSPRQAWEAAAEIYYPDKKAAREKGCPKSTFLGLCEDGLIKGIPPGEYVSRKLNKSYGIQAYRLLKKEPNLDAKSLWDKIQPAKSHNQQMDVVKALFENKLMN